MFRICKKEGGYKLTEQEKQKIKELRLKGEGYKAIATALGLSRDTVRSYCKRNKLDGDATLVQLNAEEMKNQNLLCVYCSKPIGQLKRGRQRKFCSDECRRRWWSENQNYRNQRETAIYKFTCQYCGKVFSSYGNKKRKFCCHDCYIKSRFWGEEDGI